MTGPGRIELVCPAGTPAALRAAVDAGADTVYCGFNDETNARNFPGLNFSRAEMADSIAYAHRRGAKVMIAVNTLPRAGSPALWHKAVDDVASLKADAIIVATPIRWGAAVNFPTMGPCARSRAVPPR